MYINKIEYLELILCVSKCIYLKPIVEYKYYQLGIIIRLIIIIVLYL